MADDAIALPVGPYMPAVALPGEAETEKDAGRAERFPVSVTESPAIGDHGASFMQLRTRRPVSGPEARKYDI